MAKYYKDSKGREDVTRRAVFRASEWRAQIKTAGKGSRTEDPWRDVGHPKDTCEQALEVCGRQNDKPRVAAPTMVV